MIQLISGMFLGGVPTQVAQPKMAPNLASSNNELIYDKVHSGEISPKVMALAAGYDKSHHVNESAAFYDHMVSFSQLL